MGNWLDKARGRSSSTAYTEPFELECGCGTRLSGIRQERAKRVICPQCGDAHFVLAANPYPISQRVFFGAAADTKASVAPASVSEDEFAESLPDESNQAAADHGADFVVADDSINGGDSGPDLEVRFEAIPPRVPEPASPPNRSPRTTPPRTTPPPWPSEKSEPAARETRPSRNEIDDAPIELDLPSDKTLRRGSQPTQTPPPPPPQQQDRGQNNNQTGSRAGSYDAIFDGPLTDGPLDVPLLDEAVDSQAPERTRSNSPQSAGSDADIFSDDLLGLELDLDHALGGRTREVKAHDDVVIEDTDANHKISPSIGDDGQMSLQKPRPIEPINAPTPSRSPQPIESDSKKGSRSKKPTVWATEALEEKPRKPSKKPHFDYEDIEVAELVDESLLPSAKKMARGADRLAEFDGMGDDATSAIGGEHSGRAAGMQIAAGKLPLNPLAQKHRKTRIKVVLVVALLGAIGTTMTIWAVKSGNLEQAAIDLKDGTELGIAALEAGDFPAASRELRRAVAAQVLLKVDNDRATHIRHLLYESEAAASQLNGTLFDIVDRAETAIKNNGEEDWKREFDVNYAGRWVIFYGNIDAEKKVGLPAIVGDAPIRIEGIDRLIEIASKNSNSGAIMFAGQLASCGKPQPKTPDGQPRAASKGWRWTLARKTPPSTTNADKANGDKAAENEAEADGNADDFGGKGLAMDVNPEDAAVDNAARAGQGGEPANDKDVEKKKFAPREIVENVWEIRFNPETAVLWTRTMSLQQLNFVSSDDELSKHIRDIVEQQNTAMRFPKDLSAGASVDSSSTPVAGQ